MTFPEWLQLVALLVMAAAVAGAIGILAGPSGFAFPLVGVAVAVQLLVIAWLLERRIGGGR